MDYIAIGKHLRDEREHQGLSRAMLAAEAGLHYRTVEKVEYGQSRQLSFDVVARLARVLKVSLDELDEYYGDRG